MIVTVRAPAPGRRARRLRSVTATGNRDNKEILSMSGQMSERSPDIAAEADGRAESTTVLVATRKAPGPADSHSAGPGEAVADPMGRVTTEVRALLQERQDRRKAELDVHRRDEPLNERQDITGGRSGRTRRVSHRFDDWQFYWITVLIGSALPSSKQLLCQALPWRCTVVQHQGGAQGGESALVLYWCTALVLYCVLVLY
jgi:hypothetical protein